MPKSDLGSIDRESLLQLFLNGPTWDGDVVSKAGRDELVDRGLAEHAEGFAFLTLLGVQVSLELGFDREKERRDAERRKQS